MSEIWRTAKRIPTMEMAALRRPVRTTTANFPRRIWNLLTGAVRRVSMVPRSFSPAARSIAGYIAPMKQKITKR